VRFLCIHTSNLSMKTKAISSFFVLFAIVAGIGATTPAAFADPHPIETADNDLAAPGCGETEVGCYTPNVTTIELGHTVTMSNADSAGIHTFTSGTVDGFAASPDGIFDSGILNADQSFDWVPDTPGEYPYYCMLHVWMQGVIIVQEAAAEEPMMEEEEAMMEEDIELMVTITDSIVEGGTQVDLEFSTIHVNYEITATQNGEEILKEAAHSMEMTGASHMIDAIGSDESPIDIEIVSLGIGLPGADQDWTGPTGMVAEKQVVPEFGTIAMMILAVAIISIVAVTAKSRVVPRF
jgi:predicted secreted protein with PEFG-CTERM motif